MTAVMVTGHRELPHPDTVPPQLEHVLRKLDATVALSGGAAGADLMFAEVAIRAGVPLHLLLPNRWYRAHYPGAVSDELVTAAELVTYAVERAGEGEPYQRFRWDREKWWRDNFARNRALVDASDVTVVVSDRSPSVLLGQTRERYRWHRSARAAGAGRGASGGLGSACQLGRGRAGAARLGSAAGSSGGGGLERLPDMTRRSTTWDMHPTMRIGACVRSHLLDRGLRLGLLHNGTHRPNDR